MDAYAESVGCLYPVPSKIWYCTPKQIPSWFIQRLKNVISGGLEIFEGCLTIESQEYFLDRLLKGKESKLDLKSTGEKSK